MARLISTVLNFYSSFQMRDFILALFDMNQDQVKCLYGIIAPGITTYIDRSLLSNLLIVGIQFNQNIELTHTHRTQRTPYKTRDLLGSLNSCILLKTKA